MSKGLKVVSVILHTGKSPESRARHFSADSLNYQDVSVMQDVLIDALTDQCALKRSPQDGCMDQPVMDQILFTFIGILPWGWTGEPLWINHWAPNNSCCNNHPCSPRDFSGTVGTADPTAAVRRLKPERRKQVQRGKAGLPAGTLTSDPSTSGARQPGAVPDAASEPLCQCREVYPHPSAHSVV